MMEVPWILEQEDWEQEPHHTPHQGITLPVRMVHKKRWEKQWRGDKRRVGKKTVEMRVKKTAAVQNWINAIKPNWSVSTVTRISSHARKFKTNQCDKWKASVKTMISHLPTVHRCTAGCVRSPGSFPLMAKPLPHSSSWIRRHRGNMYLHLYI